MNRFEVDVTRRVISGLIVPFNEPTHVAGWDGKRYVFTRGVLSWPEIVSRHKMRVQHDRGTETAFALSITEIPEGLWAEFKVDSSPEGDRALQKANDRIWDGFSIGLRDGAKTRDEGDLIYFTEAVLAETSLTPDPAFASARVAAVALEASASTERTQAMPETITPVVEAPASDPTPAPAAVLEPSPQTQFSAPVPVNVTVDSDAIAQSFAQLMAAAPAGPQPVNPATDFEPETGPYQFEARTGRFSPGQYDFSTDVFAAFRGDHAAHDRAMDFIRRQFDVDTADVGGLNPSRHRPDMWVPQRDYPHLLWDRIYRGPISDATPFVVPKFVSATNMAAAHVQGTEPTDGTFVATGQTITPAGISAKVKVTREVIDAGGSPQFSQILWAQMLRAHAEQLDAAVAGVLTAAAASITDVTITAGSTGGTLVGLVLGAIAQLPFERGGAAINTLATHVDLYTRLAAAVDGSGRPLLPPYGPQNSGGVARSRYQSLDLNGVEALPSYSLGATTGGASAGNSWLFDPLAVHGWASPPQRLEFNYEVAHIYIGLWGYQATAVTDTAGIRQVLYDMT